jgi:hypothetical protein
LLAHFRAEEKLPFLLEFFRISDELIDLLIFDFITEEVYLIFYHCGQNQISTLITYLKDFGNKNIYAKSAIMEAMVLVAQKNEEKKDEIRNIFQDLFDFVFGLDDEEIVETDDFVFICTELCASARGLGDQRFLEKAQKAYEKRLVDTFFFGNWDFYQESFDKTEPINAYDDIRDWYNGPGKLRDEPIKMDERPNKVKQTVVSSTPSHSPVKAEPKVGRNDPCPCGSGKKYKKCHGKA